MAFDIISSLLSGWESSEGPPPPKPGPKRSAVSKQRLVFLEAGLANIRHRDGEFRTGAFLEHVRDAVLKIKAAGSTQDLDKVIPLLTDGCQEALKCQLVLQKAAGYRDIIENLDILGAEVCQADSSAHFDAIHVLIYGTHDAKRVELDSPKKVRSWEKDRAFREVWSFLRRLGAKTKTAGGVLEGLCPNCGGALTRTRNIRCSACGSVVNSGEHDWVLFQVTDANAWTARETEAEVGGLKDFRVQDPGFCVEFLEDLAAVLFWRWMQGRITGEGGPLKRYIEPGRDRAVRAMSKAKDTLYADVAVNNASLGEVGGNEAYVQVEWAYRFYERAGTSKVRYDGQSLIRTHVFLMSREPGSITDLKSGLSSAHCAACGAPEDEFDSDSCSYCAASFRLPKDLNEKWMLRGILHRADWRRRWGRASGLPYRFGTFSWPGFSAEKTVAWLVKLIYADGTATPEEITAVEVFARMHRVPQERIVAMIRADAAGELPLPAMTDPKDALTCLKLLAWTALRDGDLSDEDCALLNLFAERFDIPDEQVDAVIKKGGFA